MIDAQIDEPGKCYIRGAIFRYRGGWLGHDIQRAMRLSTGYLLMYSVGVAEPGVDSEGNSYRCVDDHPVTVVLQELQKQEDLTKQLLGGGSA